MEKKIDISKKDKSLVNNEFNERVGSLLNEVSDQPEKKILEELKHSATYKERWTVLGRAWKEKTLSPKTFKKVVDVIVSTATNEERTEEERVARENLLKKLYLKVEKEAKASAEKQIKKLALNPSKESKILEILHDDKQFADFTDHYNPVPGEVTAESILWRISQSLRALDAVMKAVSKTRKVELLKKYVNENIIPLNAYAGFVKALTIEIGAGDSELIEKGAKEIGDAGKEKVFETWQSVAERYISEIDEKLKALREQGEQYGRYGRGLKKKLTPNDIEKHKALEEKLKTARDWFLGIKNTKNPYDVLQAVRRGEIAANVQSAIETAVGEGAIAEIENVLETWLEKKRERKAAYRRRDAAKAYGRFQFERYNELVSRYEELLNLEKAGANLLDPETNRPVNPELFARWDELRIAVMAHTVLAVNKLAKGDENARISDEEYGRVENLSKKQKNLLRNLLDMPREKIQPEKGDTEAMILGKIAVALKRRNTEWLKGNHGEAHRWVDEKIKALEREYEKKNKTGKKLNVSPLFIYDTGRVEVKPKEEEVEEEIVKIDREIAEIEKEEEELKKQLAAILKEIQELEKREKSEKEEKAKEAKKKRKK